MEYGIFFTICIACATAFPLESFYPFGSTVDTLIPANDDGSSSRINLSTPFPFFDTEYSTLYVNNNGDISFITSVSRFTPESFPLSGNLILIAPYWADVDTRGVGSVWYRETADVELLTRARDEIQAALSINPDSFFPIYLFIATWDHVGYYDSRSDKTNTFQCVMATDGVSAYVIFLYADGEIQWTTGDFSGGVNGLGGTPAHVGFNAGDGVRFAVVPDSETPEIINISSTSNIGVPGVWIFRVDQEDVIFGGCSSEPNATLTLVPRLGNMLGGTPVQVAGPCLRQTDEIICAFDGIEVPGVYMSERIALCICPQLTSVGRVPFQMTVFADGAITFRGEVIFFSISPDQGHAVDFDYPDLLFESGISFTVTWSPQFIIPFEDPSTYTVDIVLHEYDVIGNIWKELETLATNVPNSGERSVTIMADNNHLSNINTVVCQVAIQITVGRAASNMGSIGIWSGRAYMALLSELRKRCEAWCESQPANIGQEILDRLPPCPPTVQRAVEDSRFQEETLSSRIYATMFDDQSRNFFHEGAASCFRQTTIISGSGQQCCYSENGFLLTGPPGGGTVDLVAPEVSRSRHFEMDVEPYIYCCKGVFSNCDAYYSKRPSSDGTGYELPVPACVYGDPHLVTLDGLKYTFNGKGEFTLIETKDGSFMMQGRMIEAAATNGSLAQATVFSALVCKQNDSDTVQLELSRRGIDALVNGERVRFDDLSEQDYNNVVVTDLGNSTISALFSNGVHLKVKEEGGIISLLLINIPSIFLDATRGLLGTFNTNNADDLIPKFDTDPIPIDSPPQMVHEQFGITWIISDPDDSLFTYKPGENWTNFYDPAFVPAYEPVFSDLNLEAEANEICRGDQFCLFDVAATGRTDIGLSTLEGSQNFESIVQLSAPITCDPPCENGVCVANNFCSCTSGFEGVTCDQIVYTDCDVNLCENSAICLQHVTTYSCECSSGYAGSLCETLTCDPSCENGVCVSNNTCNCTTGFDGVTCSQRVYTDCDINLCENNGRCLEHAANFICECLSGFTGLLCETSLLAVDDKENNIPTIIGAAVGGIVLLFVGIVTVAVICIIARRHKRVQQLAATNWTTLMEMKECTAYGVNLVTTNGHSSIFQQEEESKMPTPGNEDMLYTYMSAPKCDITSGDGEVYENVPVVTSGDAGEDENVYETMPTSEDPEDEYIYEPVTRGAQEPDEELSYL